MEVSQEYIHMCYKAKELQDSWNPKKGDWFATKHSYCDGLYGEFCTQENICESCFGSSNVFVVSSQFNYHESVGGTVWYFNGHSCVRGSGCRMNSTASSLFRKKEYKHEESSELNSNSQDDYVWLPRLDQFSKDILIKSCEHYGFGNIPSLEKMCLIKYMSDNYNKVWYNGEWNVANDFMISTENREKSEVKM